MEVTDVRHVYIFLLLLLNSETLVIYRQTGTQYWYFNYCFSKAARSVHYLGYRVARHTLHARNATGSERSAYQISDAWSFMSAT